MVRGPSITGQAEAFAGTWCQTRRPDGVVCSTGCLVGGSVADSMASGDDRAGGPALVVEYCDVPYVVEVERTLSFGRVADLVVDDNPFLHRVLGIFRFRNDLWWLSNCGSRIRIEVADFTSASLFTIAPGAEMPLHFPSALIRFHAGKTAYELTASIDELASAGPVPMTAVDGAETITVADLPMTRDQLRLIVSLAELALRDPFAREFRLPSNRQAAQRLGWTLTKFNRKLDNVCDKLTKKGVPGLRGDVAELATDRRRRLVEYSVQVGLVTPNELALLDEAG
jgi:hypothetical protein